MTKALHAVAESHGSPMWQWATAEAPHGTEIAVIATHPDGHRWPAPVSEYSQSGMDAAVPVDGPGLSSQRRNHLRTRPRRSRTGTSGRGLFEGGQDQAAKHRLLELLGT